MAETSLGKMTSEMQSENKKWPHEELNLPFSDYSYQILMQLLGWTEDSELISEQDLKAAAT